MSGLYPVRWTAAALEEARRRADERSWASLYQQAPCPPEHAPPLMPTADEIREERERRGATVAGWLRTMKPESGAP